jgi:hypothetical protein
LSKQRRPNNPHKKAAKKTLKDYFLDVLPAPPPLDTSKDLPRSLIAAKRVEGEVDRPAYAGLSDLLQEMEVESEVQQDIDMFFMDAAISAQGSALPENTKDIDLLKVDFAKSMNMQCSRLQAAFDEKAFDTEEAATYLETVLFTGKDAIDPSIKKPLEATTSYTNDVKKV